MNRVVLAFLILGLFAGALPASAGYENLILIDMNGNEVKVDSLLAEGPVVLNFWATWCRPCRTEMPHIEKIAADLASRKVYFAAVSLDAANRMAQLKNYIVKNEIKLPVYVDLQGTLAKRFKVSAIPTTLVLDGQAEISFRTRGYRPGDEVLLKKKIEALLPAEEKNAGEESVSGEAAGREAAPEGVQAEAPPEAPPASAGEPESRAAEQAPEREAEPSDTGE